MTIQLLRRCGVRRTGQWTALGAGGIPGRADERDVPRRGDPAFPSADPSRNPRPWDPLVIMYDDDDESDEDDAFGDDDYEDEDYEDEDEFAEDDEDELDAEAGDDDEEEEETF